MLEISFVLITPPFVRVDGKFSDTIEQETRERGRPNNANVLLSLIMMGSVGLIHTCRATSVLPPRVDINLFSPSHVHTLISNLLEVLLLFSTSLGLGGQRWYTFAIHACNTEFVMLGTDLYVEAYLSVFSPMFSNVWFFFKMKKHTFLLIHLSANRLILHITIVPRRAVYVIIVHKQHPVVNDLNSRPPTSRVKFVFFLSGMLLVHIRAKGSKD